jgi:hypothetical protein
MPRVPDARSVPLAGRDGDVGEQLVVQGEEDLAPRPRSAPATRSAQIAAARSDSSSDDVDVQPATVGQLRQRRLRVVGVAEQLRQLVTGGCLQVYDRLGGSTPR